MEEFTGAEVGVDAVFLTKLAAVEMFVADHERFPAQSEVLPDGFQIGQWLDSVRRSRRRGTLSPVKERLVVERLPGFAWGSSAPDGRRVKRYDFDTMYACVWKIVDIEGCLPTATRVESTPGGDLPVGPWLHRKKRALLRGTLPEDEAELLLALPGFDVPGARRGWWSSLEMLLDWVGEHRRWPDPGDEYVAEGVTVDIGRWARAQRFWRGRLRLTPEKMAAFEGVPYFPGWPAGSIE